MHCINVNTEYPRTSCTFVWFPLSFHLLSIFRSMSIRRSHFCISLILSHIINFHKFTMHFSPEKQYTRCAICIRGSVSSLHFFWFLLFFLLLLVLVFLRQLLSLAFRRRNIVKSSTFIDEAKMHWLAAKVFWHNLCKCFKMIHNLHEWKFQLLNTKKKKKGHGKWKNELKAKKQKVNEEQTCRTVYSYSYSHSHSRWGVHSAHTRSKFKKCFYYYMAKMIANLYASATKHTL